jgi:hypothetical protein
VLDGRPKDRHYLDTRALAADVFRLRVFYYQRGFREARVELDTARAGAGMHVAFRSTKAGPSGRSVVGGGRHRARTSSRNLPLRAGQPFSMLELRGHATH